MLAISKTNFMEVYIQQVKGSGKNEDRLWLKCKASHFGFPHDLFLCFIYTTPTASIFKRRYVAFT